MSRTNLDSEQNLRRIESARRTNKGGGTPAMWRPIISIVLVAFNLLYTPLTIAAEQSYQKVEQSSEPLNSANTHDYKPIEDLTDISFLGGLWCHRILTDLKSEFSMVRENSFRLTIISKTTAIGYPYVRSLGDFKAPRFVDPSQPKRFIVLELKAAELHANISGNHDVLMRCKN